MQQYSGRYSSPQWGKTQSTYPAASRRILNQKEHGCNVQSWPGRGQRPMKSMRQMLLKFGLTHSAYEVSHGQAVTIVAHLELLAQLIDRLLSLLEDSCLQAHMMGYVLLICSGR